MSFSLGLRTVVAYLECMLSHPVVCVKLWAMLGRQLQALSGWGGVVAGVEADTGVGDWAACLGSGHVVRPIGGLASPLWVWKLL